MLRIVGLGSIAWPVAAAENISCTPSRFRSVSPGIAGAGWSCCVGCNVSVLTQSVKCSNRII